MPAAPAAMTPARTMAMARLRLRPARMALGLGEVAVAGVHDDAHVTVRVVDRHGALAHTRQRPVAAILDEPDRPAHRGDAVAAARAEVAVVVVAPQAPRRLPLLFLRRGGGARLRARARRRRAAQLQL